MAEDQDQGERSEEATQTRREDFRKRGQVAQTKELATALFLLVGMGAIYALSKFFFKEIYELFTHSFGDDLVAAVKQGDILVGFKYAGLKMAILIAPVLGIGAVIALGATLLQVGFLQVEDAFSPDLSRLDPIAGFGRIFAMKNLVEALKSIVKLLLVTLITYYTLKHDFFKTSTLIQSDVEQIATVTQSLIAKLLGSLGIAILFLALADYFIQKYNLEKQMMMTKQEIKEENRSREGDPMIKARVRKTQREMANRRMMDKVPKADVIITNPTHIAVALKYDANLPAPQLIAKGADLIADKIKEIAKANSIPIVENKPLARTIFKTMKLGQVIPRELFVAVAEVLSYIYKLRKKKVTG
jgi:flagellar biosynthetic protein FlhB